MNRIPGRPDQKLSLLSKIDPKTLPYLVADLLYFSLGHREVLVVDGPGDGKRDVHSITPSGERHITQCKYHQNTTVSVSSDETDELVLALLKYGCKNGLFVTTGKISPQAKREYLDNYPNFTLSFLDGVNLVENIVASPVLAAVWIRDTDIAQNRIAIQIPFLLRNPHDDRPILIDDFSDVTFGNNAYEFETGYFLASDFAPYHPPVMKNQLESGAGKVRCQLVCVSGEVSIGNIESIKQNTINIISENMQQNLLPITVRLGTPRIIPLSGNHQDDRIEIKQVQPSSYVIASDRKVSIEEDWLVISHHKDWIFPSLLSVSEADWAGWFNRSKNTMFMQILGWPIFGEQEYITTQIRDTRRVWLEKSLFITGGSSDCANFLNHTPGNLRPDWNCSYGPHGMILGWLHPAAQNQNNVLIQYDPDNHGVVQVEYTGPIIDDYNKKAANVCDLLANYDLKEIDFEKVNLISKVEGKELLSSWSMQACESAELVHYFRDVPSPAYLKDRKFVFVRMWKIDNNPTETKDIVASTTIDLISNADLHWDIKRGYVSKHLFLLSSLTYLCPPEISADDFFDRILLNLDIDLATVGEYIRSTWTNAELATEEFWRTEVGFMIDEHGFQGTLWDDE